MQLKIFISQKTNQPNDSEESGGNPIVGGREFTPGPGQNVSFRDVDPPPPPPPADIGYQSVQIKNHEKLVTFSSDFLLPGQTPEQWFPIGQGDIEEPTPNVYLELAKTVNKAEKRLPGIKEILPLDQLHKTKIESLLGKKPTISNEVSSQQQTNNSTY